MNMKLLKTEEDYRKAIERINGLIDCKEGSQEEDELEILSLLVWDYEEKHFTIEQLQPIEALRVRMNELGMTSEDLKKIIGDKDQVSAILSKKRKLTLKMIREIHKKMNIPVETLIQEY